jgi:DNA-binding response OmpR family regulator
MLRVDGALEARKVLVVDDEPKLAAVFCSYLQSAGFHPVSAGTGAQALRLF